LIVNHRGERHLYIDGEMAWRKAIPQNRDRQQSQALALGAGAILAILSIQTVAVAYSLAKQFPAFVFGAFGISVFFALTVFGLRAATAAGAACGAMTCLLLTIWTGSSLESLLRTGLTPLILLFVLTFLATRMGRQRKTMAGLTEERRGRNAAQVIANLGVPAASSSLTGIGVLLGWLPHTVSVRLVGAVALAALAEATADTVSSEIGQAFGGRPVMLTTLRRVAPGTDGAVSLVGTVAGIAAGAAVVWAGRWALRLGIHEASIAFLAACAGLFFDSLLGATVERCGWLGNDLVNFTSTLFAAVIALGLLIALR
jgi:uncharacterized protein (TIGR00297 family)